MFSFLKFVLVAAGCVAFYGISTGADLNELFAHVLANVLPVAKSVIYGIITWLKSAVLNS